MICIRCTLRYAIIAVVGLGVISAHTYAATEGEFVHNVPEEAWRKEVTNWTCYDENISFKKLACVYGGRLLGTSLCAFGVGYLGHKYAPQYDVSSSYGSIFSGLGAFLGLNALWSLNYTSGEEQESFAAGVNIENEKNEKDEMFGHVWNNKGVNVSVKSLHDDNTIWSIYQPFSPYISKKIGNFTTNYYLRNRRDQTSPSAEFIMRDNRAYARAMGDQKTLDAIHDLHDMYHSRFVTRVYTPHLISQFYDKQLFGES